MKSFNELADFYQLVREINNKSLVFQNLLIGNGLGLSHPNPKINEVFTFVAKKFIDNKLIEALEIKRLIVLRNFSRNLG
ncbi:MAG: hypothetical protein FJX03_01510 [Alphaproteobacteria bacterium]|nr:hypothetical protein [Alphaproteobacteria bacterium]